MGFDDHLVVDFPRERTDFVENIKRVAGGSGILTSVRYCQLNDIVSEDTLDERFLGTLVEDGLELSCIVGLDADLVLTQTRLNTGGEVIAEFEVVRDADQTDFVLVTFSLLFALGSDRGYRRQCRGCRPR